MVANVYTYEIENSMRKLPGGPLTATKQLSRCNEYKHIPYSEVLHVIVHLLVSLNVTILYCSTFF